MAAGDCWQHRQEYQFWAFRGLHGNFRLLSTCRVPQVVDLMNTLAASESLAGRGSAGWVHRTHADYIRALGRACAPAQHLDSGASTIYSMCQCDFSPACAACGRRPRPASARRLISLMGDLQTELHWQTRMARRTRPGGRLPAVVHTVLSNCGSPLKWIG